MAVFLRRFLFDPGESVLLNIESVNVLDLEPPAPIRGVGSGAVQIIGEFENGPFTPTEISSASDLANTFGTLGYTVNGQACMYPCAVARKADGAINAEYWNGNGFVQLNGKQFARLFIVRVDTSVGAVQFTRLPFVTGGALFRYPLSSGQVLSLDLGAGGVSATFTGTAATVTAVGGTYPTAFAGGETLTLGFDDPAAHPNFQVTFLAADQTIDQVITRINIYAGFTFVDKVGSQLRFTGLKLGTGGQVRIVSGSTGVLTKLGLTAATTVGGGNVADTNGISFTEIKTIVEAAIAGTKVEQDSSNRLRVSATSAASIAVTSSTTATGLGFTVGSTSTGAAGVAGKIPAGTVVQNSGGTVKLVTMQDVSVTATSAGPYVVKVRHAVDDGSGIAAAAGSITAVATPPDLGAFSVVNPQVTTAALTEAAIDAQYSAAIGLTLDPGAVTRETNISWCARQSNMVRRTMRQNALDASANGLLGRIAVIRPPLNTAPAVAMSTTAEPGVSAYRDRRVIYCYIGANTTVPLIARSGLAGGAGFTATGAVDVGSDGWMACILSQLPPEENPGQLTPFTGEINGIETGANVQGLQMSDYINFKSAGIAALRMDSGAAIFQSGVTSVDPSTNPGLVRISRQRMDDFVNDSISRKAKGYGKKLSTNVRRAAFKSDVTQFFNGLLGKDNPGSQRIAGYSIIEGSSANFLASGGYRLKYKVKTLPSLDSFVLEATVGEFVDVDVVLPAAA